MTVTIAQTVADLLLQRAPVTAVNRPGVPRLHGAVDRATLDYCVCRGCEKSAHHLHFTTAILNTYLSVIVTIRTRQLFAQVKTQVIIKGCTIKVTIPVIIKIYYLRQQENRQQILFHLFFKCLFVLQ